MRRRVKFIGVAAIVFGTAFMALITLLVFSLWNALMPAIFGLRAITFWQALGILALSRILFGGFAGHGFARSRRMTPEERERFRQRMRERCGFVTGV